MTSNKKRNTYHLALAGLLTTIAVVGSTLSVPVFGAKAVPVQHIINVLAGVILGPGYAVLIAFSGSLLRNLLGLGTILAFPGSMFGALLAGLLAKYKQNIYISALGEIIGTAIFGSLAAYYIALILFENQHLSLFIYVVPFFLSTLIGSVIAIIFLKLLDKRGIIDQLKEKKM